MGNIIKKNKYSTNYKSYKPYKPYKSYKPRKIIQPTVRFTTYGGEPINIKPKYSHVYNGFKGGFYI